MKDRIKDLRKHFNLTQEAFADRLGIKRGAIANYEIGRNVPADSVIALICREFNVSEAWLREGTGEMFAPKPAGTLDALVEEHHLSTSERILIEKFLALDPKVRAGIVGYVISAAEAITGGVPAQPEPEDLHELLDDQIALEKNPPAASGAS